MNNEYIILDDELVEELFISMNDGNRHIQKEERGLLIDLLNCKYIREENNDIFIVGINGRKKYIISEKDGNMICSCKINDIYNEYETILFNRLLIFVTYGIHI